MTIAVINTSTANIASVLYALDRLSAPYRLVDRPEEAQDCTRLILPGVGAAGPAMAALHKSGWVEVLREETRPLLGICLGMQLLFDYSEESDVELLGLIPGRVERLMSEPKLVWPHMGWNALEAVNADEPLLNAVEPGARVYFVHGFYVKAGPACQAKARYGDDITAIARQGHIVGCQFHPERSGAVGAKILANFITDTTSAEARP